MKNPDGSIPIPEEHKVTAMQLFLEMDMLDFTYICQKMELMEAAKRKDYKGYRKLQREEMPVTQAQHMAARDALWNFLKECVPDIEVARGSSWEFDHEKMAVYENKPLRRPQRGDFLPFGEG